MWIAMTSIVCLSPMQYMMRADAHVQDTCRCAVKGHCQTRPTRTCLCPIAMVHIKVHNHDLQGRLCITCVLMVSLD